MIYYDITDVLEYARFNTTLSGIQRVSIQLINDMVNKHGVDSLRLIGFHPRLKKITSFGAEFFGGRYHFDQHAFCTYFGLKGGESDLDLYLSQRYGKSLKKGIHRARLIVINQLSGGRAFEKRKIVKSSPKLKSGHYEIVSRLSRDDIVFIGGATWNFDEYLTTLARLRNESGAKLYHFIHDIIPLVTPEHVVENVPEQFNRWLKHLSANCDLFLTNSKATKDDLDAWLTKRDAVVESRVVRLGHQFVDLPRETENVIRMGERVRAHILNAARLPYVLCVGTIESRKNVWTLANVWQQVHARLGYATPRLLFAGKHGWLKEDFDDFMRGTGALNGFIRVVERPDDHELAYLYRNCLFSVFPSYKEGWGLPIGECMWFGRPVVASGVSSMPEVGGDLIDYVDPLSPESIETALLRMITDTDYREQRASAIAAAPLRTWSDVADELWRELTLVHPEMSRASIAPGARDLASVGGRRHFEPSPAARHLDHSDRPF